MENHVEKLKLELERTKQAKFELEQEVYIIYISTTFLSYPLWYLVLASSVVWFNFHCVQLLMKNEEISQLKEDCRTLKITQPGLV